MAAFLLLTWVGGHWPGLYRASYVAKTIAAAALLIYYRHHYTKIRWNYWWLGILVGIVGVVQWVGMEKSILHFWPNYPRPSVDIYNPYEHFGSAATMWSFIIIRWLGASLMVPFMEELFWRDYLWRTILAPNDFKLADDDLDTGSPTEPGEYALSDKTYARLLQKLAETNFAQVSHAYPVRFDLYRLHIASWERPLFALTHSPDISPLVVTSGH